MTRFLPSLFTVALALTLVACGEDPDSSSSTGTSGQWERLTDVPLSPRENAVGVATGTEALVLGGSDAPPCPANADCIPADVPPLRDGAAFDPERRTWRRIAEAPVGFSDAEGVVVDGVAYVWAPDHQGRPGVPSTFLAYRISEDRWKMLPQPPGTPVRSIVAAGPRIVAFSTSDEQGRSPDQIFDPATEEWSALPSSPLPRSFDRTMAWSGAELVLFAKRIVPQPGAGEPSLALAAALDLETGEWRRLPDSESLDQYVTNVRWFEVDGRLINPAPGSAKGGGSGAGDWGRPYPDGGILDPASSEWSELPAAPEGVEEFAGRYGAGVLDGTEAHYFGYQGRWILDAQAEEWIEIPPLDNPGAITGGRTVTAAGDEMLVFGGVRFPETRPGRFGEGRLLNEAWVWSPRGTPGS